jgi:hypothetical protein
MKKFSELLIELDACQEAREWAADKTWHEVYATCHRGDWLLWLFKKTNPEKLRELILAKAHCANTVRHLMTDERSTNAIDVAIKFGNNEATIEELKAAAAAAYAAYAGADVAYAASAAGAATAYAAYAGAAADAYAASAAYAAGAAADAYADPKEKNLQLTADICRQYLPIEIWQINQ